VSVVQVGSAAELGAACRAQFESCDVLLMAAAVADFRPAEAAGHKLKKTDPQTPKAIQLEPTEDVLAQLASRRGTGQVLVGFAAEHGAGAVAYGRDKLARKGLDAIVVNDIARSDIGFHSAHNEVTILARDGVERQIARAPKEAIADAILDEVARLRDARAPSPQPRPGDAGPGRHDPEAGDGAGRPAPVGGSLG